MNEKDYLKELGATDLDKKVLENMKQKMHEETIPQIVRNIKNNERLVAEMRISPTSSSKKKS